MLPLSKLWLAVPVLTACVISSLSCCEAVPIQLHGLNYNTRKGPDWDPEKCKEWHEVLRDLTMLSRMTNRIRLLSLTDCGQAHMVLDVAHELGMQMWLGMWVGPDTSVFEDEKAALRGMLEAGMIDEATVLGVSVGSEAIYRKDATVNEMIGYMNEVYQILQDAGLNIPVTICDVAPQFAASSKLRAAVNVTMTNTFPFWEAIPISLAADELQTDLSFLLQQPESKNKPFILGETGWPSDGYIEGVGIAGPDEQLRYFKEAFCLIDVVNGWSYYWFTFIDNAWRREQDPNNTIEGNWGFLYANLTLKPHFEGFEFTCGNGVTYSFAEVDWSIPDFTAAPAVMDPASCSAHSNCEGLFGNCCPGDDGLFLGCCDTRAPSVAPAIAPSSNPASSKTSAPAKDSTATIAGPTARPTSEEEDKAPSNKNANSGTSSMGPGRNVVVIMGAAMLSGLLLHCP